MNTKTELRILAVFVALAMLSPVAYPGEAIGGGLGEASPILLMLTCPSHASPPPYTSMLNVGVWGRLEHPQPPPWIRPWLSPPALGEIEFRKGAPHVKLPNGNAVLSGKLEFSREGRPFSSFLGIPYATIPERFQEAELIQKPSWDGVFNAVEHGPMCVQAVFGQEQVINIGDENCLSLNVFVPMNNTREKGGYPVMVWIHGGGFVAGGASMTGPKYFMDEDVILVKINYRLGVFGFLSTGDDVIPGNNGLKDQVIALRWVKENIKAFGGNSDRVTIFGESAGGSSVHWLLLSPTTQGLFQQAISQSGNALAAAAIHPEPRKTAVKLAAKLKCPTASPNPNDISSEEIATCLKSQTKEALNEAAATINPIWPPGALSLAFGPVVEPKKVKSGTPFNTELPWKTVNDKSIPLKKVPWMTGICEDEGSGLYGGYILHNAEWTQELDSKWDELVLAGIEFHKFVTPEEKLAVTQKIRQFYFKDKPISLQNRKGLSNLYTDAMFAYSSRKAAIETASKGNPVYLYQYEMKGPSLLNVYGFPMPEEEINMVGHGDDLVTQFDIGFVPGFENAVEPGSELGEFSKNFVKLWVSFAKNGKPTHSFGPSKENWYPISQDEAEGKRPLKWFRLMSNPKFTEESTGLKERMDFWEKLHKDHFLQSMLSDSKAFSGKTEL